jgi:aarF domain-containing kinase
MSSAHKKSGFSRSAKLLGTFLDIGKKEVQSRVSAAIQGTLDSDMWAAQLLKTRIAQAAVFSESLGELKGAAMKFGQLLSIEGADFLPKEVIDVLSKLQDQAPALPPREIETLIRKELSPALFAELKELELHPLASASIGQVHKAKFRGQSIVLKVQYPDVSKTIDSDLSILRKAMSSVGWLTQKSYPLDNLFEELNKVLKQEADYRIELQNTLRYAEQIKNDSRFVIPKPIAELSSERLLALSFEAGERLNPWIESKPPAELCEFVGRSLLDLYMDEFFNHGFVQTDPNFGNFFIRPESKQVVLLDFGATRHYPSEFIDSYKRLLKVIDSGNSKHILSRAIDEMRLLSPQESPETKEFFVQMLKASTLPFRAQQPFNFKDKDYANEVRDSVVKLVRAVRYSGPPHQLIFLHRKLGGLYNILKRLEVKIDLSSYWEKISQ